MERIISAKTLAEGLSRTHPDQAPWPTLFALLDAYEARARGHWPLTPDESESGTLGWFSVRNIEEKFPQLHEALNDVAASFRESE